MWIPLYGSLHGYGFVYLGRPARFSALVVRRCFSNGFEGFPETMIFPVPDLRRPLQELLVFPWFPAHLPTSVLLGPSLYNSPVARALGMLYAWLGAGPCTGRYFAVEVKAAQAHNMIGIGLVWFGAHARVVVLRCCSMLRYAAVCCIISCTEDGK